MNIKTEIISFSSDTGSLCVKYFSDELPDGLVYNIDIPLKDGVYPSKDEIDGLIKHMTPTGQLERIAALKKLSVPDYLVHSEKSDVFAINITEQIRNQRNILLSNTDWTQTLDAPLSDIEKAEWSRYRQELRDISNQEGFPENILWPVVPSNK